MAECWSCGAERGEAALCTICGKVQPISRKRDYFAILGIPRAMRIDSNQLERSFREISRQVHPDRFGRASAVERKLALEQTTHLNDAYRTLRDPSKRAEHLMRLEGVDIGGEESRTRNVELLGEMLELQEQVDTEKSKRELEQMRSDAITRQAARMADVARYFDEHAGTKERTIEVLDELRYIGRLLEHIELKLEASG